MSCLLRSSERSGRQQCLPLPLWIRSPGPRTLHGSRLDDWAARLVADHHVPWVRHARRGDELPHAPWAPVEQPLDRFRQPPLSCPRGAAREGLRAPPAPARARRRSGNRSSAAAPPLRGRASDGAGTMRGLGAPLLTPTRPHLRKRWRLPGITGEWSRSAHKVLAWRLHASRLLPVVCGFGTDGA